MSWLIPFEIGATTGLTFSWVVVGLALAFRLLRFPDLSVEGSLLLGAGLFGQVLRHGGSPLLAVAVAMLAGALVGTTTAVLAGRFGVNKFLAGILVVAVCYTVTLRIMRAPNLSLLSQWSLVSVLPVTDPPGRWSLAVLLGSQLLGMGILAWMLSTPFGLRVRTAAVNPKLASALGIAVLPHLVAGLALTNILAALSGVLIAQQQGFVDISMGAGVVLVALAAQTIGEALISGRLPVVAHALISAALGAIVYYVLQSLALQANVNPIDLKLATAVLVLAVIATRTSRVVADLEDNLG